MFQIILLSLVFTKSIALNNLLLTSSEAKFRGRDERRSLDSRVCQHRVDAQQQPVQGQDREEWHYEGGLEVVVAQGGSRSGE